MEIVADRLDWTQFDEEKWRGFLDTETGRRLIPKILESIPSLLTGGETNAILIRSGELRGLQLSVSRMLELSHSSPETQTQVIEAYPSPENDAAWDDGRKLDPNPEPRPVNDIV